MADWRRVLTGEPESMRRLAGARRRHLRRGGRLTSDDEAAAAEDLLNVSLWWRLAWMLVGAIAGAGLIAFLLNGSLVAAIAPVVGVLIGGSAASAYCRSQLSKSLDRYRRQQHWTA